MKQFSVVSNKSIPTYLLCEKRSRKSGARVKLDCEGWKGGPSEGEKNLQIHNREREKENARERENNSDVDTFYIFPLHFETYNEKKKNMIRKNQNQQVNAK